MLRSARRTRPVLLLVVALLAALAIVGTGPNAQSAQATQAEAERKVRVYGQVRFPQHDSPGVKMLWFDREWGYLGQQWANGGGYSIKLTPGTYHLQFVDQRQPWVTSKYAPTDIQVTVSSRPVEKNVTMKRGGAITGTARARGRALAGAKVIAANKVGQSFATTANRRGQFAVGGLPAGKYCLFTYDRAKEYVDKCTWAGAVDNGQVKNQPVALRKRAGSLTVFIETPTGGDAPRSTVTVTSKSTGQWWTATSKGGKAVFRGLYPGRYALKYDGAGIWLSQSGTVRNGSVRSGSMDFGDFRVTKRGGWLTGAVVDASDSTRGLSGAVVTLYASNGAKLAETTSTEDGTFTLSGAITTQSGLTIVLATQYSDYLGEDPLRCQYVRTELTGFAASTGRETYVGDLGIDRLSPQTKQGCEA